MIGAGIPMGDDAASLDRRRAAVIVEKAAGDEAIGAGARGGVVAAALPDPGSDIAAHVVMDPRRFIRQRIFQIDDRGQRLEFDGDVGERILGEIAAFREHHRQRLADVADLAFGERHLGALIEGDVLDRRRRDQQRTGRPVITEILGGIDRDDAGARPRRGNIDRSNARVRDVAAQEGCVQHSGKFDVVDEQRLTGQQPGVLVAGNRRAEIARGHNVHFCCRSAASCTAWTIC